MKARISNILLSIAAYMQYMAVLIYSIIASKSSLDFAVYILGLAFIGLASLLVIPLIFLIVDFAKGRVSLLFLTLSLGLLVVIGVVKSVVIGTPYRVLEWVSIIIILGAYLWCGDLLR